MKLNTKVTVRMSKGPNRTGKLILKESNRGEWYVIREDGTKLEFKARPSQVTAI